MASFPYMKVLNFDRFCKIYIFCISLTLRYEVLFSCLVLDCSHVEKVYILLVSIYHLLLFQQLFSIFVLVCLLYLNFLLAGIKVLCKYLHCSRLRLPPSRIMPPPCIDCTIHLTAFIKL